MTEERIAGNFNAAYNDYDLMSMIVVCPPSDGKDSEGILRLLGVLLSENCKLAEKQEVLSKEFGIPLEDAIKGDADIMCNWSAGVIEKTMLKNLKNLIKNSNIKEEEAMEILEIPAEERQRYTQLLKEGF